MTTETARPEEYKRRRRLWTAALRSGDYQQGVGALRRKNDENGCTTYCCLGVGADVARRNGIGIDWKQTDLAECCCGDPDCAGVRNPTFDGDAGYWTQALFDWYGIERSGMPGSATPMISDGNAALPTEARNYHGIGNPIGLTVLNDGVYRTEGTFRATFPQIADMIDEEWNRD